MLLHGILLVFIFFGPQIVRVKTLTPTSVFGAQAMSRQDRGDRAPSLEAKVAAAAPPVPLASDSAKNRGEQAGGRGSASSAWLQLL